MKALPKTASHLLSAVVAFTLGWGIKSALTPESGEEGSSGHAIVSPNVPITSSTASQNTARSSTTESIEAHERSAFADFMRDGVIAGQDMRDAVKTVTTERDPLKRATMFSELLTFLTADNAKDAFTTLRDSQRRKRTDASEIDQMRLLLNAWGRIDGANAVAEVAAMSTARNDKRKRKDIDSRKKAKGNEGDYLHNALSGWTTVDAESAIDYVNSLEAEKERAYYNASIVEGLLVNGVTNATDFIRQLPEGDRNRGRYMAEVAEEVLKSGVTSAMSWVENLPDDLRGGAIEQVASQYARTDLGAALNWIDQHAGEGYAKKAVAHVAGRWAKDDPVAVIDWATDLPDKTQAGVVERALSKWTQNDPVAASEYLAAMPANAAKDSAIGSFASNLARQDPESAAIWATTIEDEKTRTQALTDVARNWLRQDEAAAMDWLPDSGLTEESVLAALKGDKKSNRKRDKVRAEKRKG